MTRAALGLRRFAAIGVVVTVVDVGVLAALARGAGWPPLAADLVGIVVAAVLSFLANRAITFADDPAVRWVRSPATFVATAAFGGAVDLAVLGLVLAAFEPSGTAGLLAAKAPALLLAAIFRTRVYRTVLFDQVRADVNTRSDRGPAPGSVRLTVVVPAYREVTGIATTVARLRTELGGLLAPGDLEVVVVDDGSGDGTGEAASAAGADQVLVQPQNRGKGAAVRAGMLAAHGRTVAFVDADLAYAPAQVERLLAVVESGWDVVVGSRLHAETTTLVRARRVREFGGRLINRTTHAVLLGQYRDTQCGIKAFRSDVARMLFTRARIDGFAFDVEIFHLVERYHLSLTEVPVEVENSTRSTVQAARDGRRMVADLVRIVRWGRQGHYDLSPGERAVLSTTEAVPEDG